MIRHNTLTVIALEICLIAKILCQNPPIVNDLPKCCDFQSFVVKENSTLTCKKSTSRRLQVNHNFIDATDDQKLCIDIFESNFFIFEQQNGDLVLKDNISAQAFRKCCPLGYLYNYQNKSCEEIDNRSSLPVALITVGLLECKIIKDYLLESSKSISEHVDRNYSNKCLDETTSGEYVLRVCENISICKNSRCLHKCCKDGRSFVNGSKCKDTFEKGLYLQHLSKNIENLTGKETGFFIFITLETLKILYAFYLDRYTLLIQ